MSLSAARTEIIGAAVRREDHAAELDAVAAGLDKDGYRQAAGRVRARALTLREAAETLRELAGRGPLCQYQHDHGTAGRSAAAA